MRKLRIMLVATAIVLSSFSGVVKAVAQPLQSYEQYFGKYVERENTGSGVWQSNGSINEGGSSVGYGLEVVDGASNKFLRFANFNGIPYSSSTSVNFALDYNKEWSSVLNVAFSYRLSEGAFYYDSDDVVFSISVGGLVKDFKLSDLSLTTTGKYDWNVLEASMPITAQNKADRMALTYYYDGSLLTTKSARYLDVDNVTVSSGDQTLYSTDVEFAPITTSDTLNLSVDYSTNTIANKKQLMLSGEEIAFYAQNNVYSKKQSSEFGGADVASLFPRTGSYMYRGSTSVKAGESDLFVLYDKEQQNSFLRLANFNGEGDVTNSRFIMKFYSNKSNEIENMPVTFRIFYSFNYRLYVNDRAKTEINPADKILNFSTRSSSANNSGLISFDELIINEENDSTWHTYNGVLEVYSTTTADISIYYYAYQNASITPDVYLDMDNLTLCPDGSNENYAYLNGSFEGMVPTVSTGDDPINAMVYNNETLGAKGEKVSVDNMNYAMQLNSKQSLSLDLNWQLSTNVYYASFDVLQDAGSIDLYFGSRSGDKLQLTVGENGTFNGGALEVYWTKNQTGYSCSLYYARLAKERLFSLDFVNAGAGAITIDNIFVGEVSSICNQAGDYQAFSALYQSLKETYETNDNYDSSTQMQIKQALYQASLITEHSSQAKMTSAITELQSYVLNGGKKADLTELLSAIKDAKDVYKNAGKSAYTNSTWILFETAYANAREITENDAQSKVDEVVSQLYAAIRNLKPVATPQSNTVTVALSVSGGLAGVGGIALATTIIIKRRKENEEN